MRETEQKTVKLARSLRRRMTDAEVILWSRLRRNAVLGFQFRRQHPIGPYVADFVCVPARLVIEIDGEIHGRPKQISHDRKRDRFLKEQDWRILRFTGQDVFKNLNGVLDGIALHLPPPRPAAGSPIMSGTGSPPQAGVEK